MPMLRSTRRAAREDGISTLEVVVLFPAVFVFMLVAIQAAMYHYSRQVVLAAAEEGARTASRGDPTNPASLTPGVTTANGFLTTVGGHWVTGSTRAPIVIYDNLTGQARIRLTVTGQAASLVYGLNFSISQSVEIPFETFTHG